MIAETCFQGRSAARDEECRRYLTEQPVPGVGARLTLACSCTGEVIVAHVITLPRHHVARIVKRGESCQLRKHVTGARVVITWRSKRGRREYCDRDSMTD